VAKIETNNIKIKAFYGAKQRKRREGESLWKRDVAQNHEGAGNEADKYEHK
jgi:hypothetical protein